MKRYKSPFISLMFWVVMVIFLVITAISVISVPKNNNGTLCRSDMKWFTLNNTPLNLNDKSQVSSITQDKSYSAYFVADKDDENVTLAFKANFSEVQVYINDTLIYSTKNNSDTDNDIFFAFDAPVSGIHLTDIKKIDKGDKILLKVNTFYNDIICGVSNVLYGKSYDIVNTVFKKDIVGMLICVAVFAIGTLMFIFHLSFRNAIYLNGIKYAACFSFLAAFHAFSEWATISFMFIMGNKAVYMMHALTFIFMLLPIIMFFMENMKYRASYNCLRVSSIIQTIFTLCITIIAAVNIYDLHKSSAIVEWVGLAQCIFILVVLLFDLGKRKERRSSDVFLPILYLVFIICAILGHSLYDGIYISVVFILSCLMFLSIVLIINMRKVAKILQLSNEVEEMGKAAFTDALTGVGNTAAFNKKIAHLEVVKLNYNSIVIVQFDINNLKTINDNLGHEQGDKLIRDGSAIIYKVFGKIGNVYRTGGDEFVCIICGNDAITLCYNAIASFDMAIDEYNSDESHKFILQIAYGSEYYSSEDDRRYMTLKEIQKKADANMYKKKSEMKTKVTKEQILKREPLNHEDQ